ncbi:MAG: DIP1984 family protein [Tissierellia bacterium]|nr:DIP1984 family protein [Tissierellia bacterium]
MKIAEALIRKSALQTDLSSLVSRIKRNLVVQEGESPQEDSKRLIEEFIGKYQELEGLIRRIQNANATSLLADEEDEPMEATIQDALIKTDNLYKMSEILRNIAGEAVPNVRYSQSEIKLIPTVDSTALLKRADEFAKEARELDILIQKTNWMVDI